MELHSTSESEELIESSSEGSIGILVCDFCDAKVSSRGALKEHILVNHDCKNPNCSCKSVGERSLLNLARQSVSQGRSFSPERHESHTKKSKNPSRFQSPQTTPSNLRRGSEPLLDESKSQPEGGRRVDWSSTEESQNHLNGPYILNMNKRVMKLLPNTQSQESSCRTVDNSCQELNEESAESGSESEEEAISCKKCDLIINDTELYFLHLWVHKWEKNNPVDTKYVGDEAFSKHSFYMDLDTCSETFEDSVTDAKTSVLHRYFCDYCGASFNKAGYLKLHLKKHEYEKPASKPQRAKIEFTCKICKSRFPNRWILHKHTKKHKGKPLKVKVTCSHCRNSFGKSHFSEHLRTHFPDRIFTCRLCQKSFTILAYFNAHMSSHEGKKIECNFCDKMFKTRWSLNKHKKTKHKDCVKYSCPNPDCSKSYLTLPALKIHLLQNC